MVIFVENRGTWWITGLANFTEIVLCSLTFAKKLSIDDDLDLWYVILETFSYSKKFPDLDFL